MRTEMDVRKTVAEIEAVCEKYDFWQRTIMPYSFRMTVEELVKGDGWQNYEQYEPTSKAIIRDEIKGFLDILDAWVKIEEEPKVEIECILGNKKGQRLVYAESTANELIAIGFAKRV